MDFAISGHFGDFEIENGDIRLISDDTEIIKNIIITRLKNNTGDSYVPFGANISSLIGRPVDDRLVSLFKDKVINALTFDGFLKKNSIEIIAIKNINRIMAKVIVANERTRTNNDSIVISFIFNNDGGVSGI
jgi:hypothetical protein